MKRLGLASIALALLITGCGGEDYWDGGQYAGRAVSTESELTKEAHDELDRCGFSDDEIGGLTQPETTAKIRVSSGGGSTRVTVTPIAPGVWEYACSV